MIQEAVIIRVSVKWGAEKFNELPLELTSSIQKFKQLLSELSKVPINKQKLIYKGQTLKDDVNLLNLKIGEGSQLMMMGQAEENAILQATGKTIFIEDLTPEQKAKILKEKAGIVLPTGLVNLGNTCYLNSSIQCMRRVNELKKFVMESNQNTAQASQSKQLFKATQGLFQSLEKKGQSFKPAEFVMKFMNVFPMFAEREANNGPFKQQDADECFQNILQTIEPLCNYETVEGRQSNLIRDLFEIDLEVTLRNEDIPEEPISVQNEYQKKLMCIIDNEAKPINTIVEGIKASLEGQLMKTSNLDNQNHLYKRQQKIKKLPSYLLVQMVRFFWKQGIQGKEGQKSKILRNVSFPKILDVFEFCGAELQKNLQTGREFERKKLLDVQQVEKDKLEEFKKKMEEKGEVQLADTREVFKKFKEDQKEEMIKEHDQVLYRDHGFGLDTGNYEIVAVLTHKGRFADSGHYVAWVHETGDRWVCYDDDLVSEVGIEDILALRGGGDWHMGYYLLYRKLEVQ